MNFKPNHISIKKLKIELKPTGSNLDIYCGVNETFCFESMTCKEKGPLKNSSYECRHNEVFCPYTASCTNITDCAPLPARNYSKALENDTFGWVHMCQIRNLICPKVARAMIKCEHDKQRCGNSSCPKGEKLCNDDYCLPVNVKCCPVGQYRCNETEDCLTNETMHKCCRKGLEFCRYTNSCSADCSKPRANDTFPTVWKYTPLGSDLIKGIFGDGKAAIALQSIVMHGVNGSLEFYGNSTWTNVQNLLPSNALVLGPDNYIRFNSSKRGSHGIVLVNFTAYTDASKVGEYVDASSISWEDGQTMAIFELPLLLAPKFEFNGSIFTTAEDTKEDVYFDVWDQLHDGAPKVDTNMDILESLLEDINQDMGELYYDLLTVVQSVDVGFRIKPTKEKIKFKGGSTEDMSENKTQLQFIPQKDFHGNVSFSMESFLISKNKTDMAIAYFFSPDVAQALRTVVKGKESSLARKVLFMAIKENIKPDHQSLRKLVQNSKDPELSSQVVKAVQYAEKVLNITYGPDSNDPFAHIVANQKRVHIGNGGEVKFFGDEIKIRIVVTPINDRPMIKRNRANLEPIPYNLTGMSYRGSRVKDLFDQSKADALVFDVDDPEIGAVILAAENSSLGQWQYKMNDSMSFTDFNFTKDVQVMLLPPEAIIIFNLHDPYEFWTSSQAFKKGAFVKVKAWDMTEWEPGVYDKSIQDNGTSISEKFANLVLLRRGCDNKTDFPGRDDRCGVCRGKDKCLGCDDEPNSGAIIDKCGQCTGGTTNKTFNYLLDCANQCDKNVNDSVLTCGKCMNKNKIRNFTDCTGTCFGGAKINTCGNCAGGQSGRPEDYGKDSCDICSGDNTTCADCAGVPNGKSVIDFCGSCLKETDGGFNTGCSSFGKFGPVSGEAGAATVVTLKGAGYKSLTLQSCQFNNSATSQKHSSTSNSKTSNVITVTTPTNLPVGTYSIICNFTNALQIETENTVFTVYNRSTISLSSISPDEAEINSPAFNVTINGTGFVDTGFLLCVKAGTSINTIIKIGEGHFVSSTSATCTFSQTAKSDLFNVSLMFGRNDPAVDSTVEFSLYAEQPNAEAIKFSNNPIKMSLTLDRPAKLKTDNSDYSCSAFFHEATLAKFTSSGTQCVLVTPRKMEIRLIGSGATIAPGDTVIFKNDSFETLKEKNTKPVSGNTSLVVGSPSNAPVPKIKVEGPNKIGPCAPLEINTITRNDGGRPMNFEWYVKEKAGVDANTTADMTALNATLKNLTSFSPYISISKDYIVRNVEYEIVVKASNFLGESAEESLAVTRVADAVPEITLSSTGETILRSQNIRIQTSVTVPGCNGSEASGFIYVWELKDSSDDPADLGSDTDLTKPYLKLKGSNLQGGENYTLTVNVFDAADTSIQSSASITVQVQPSDLIAIISGVGDSFDVGYEEDLVLDGSKSKDPDKSSDDSVYSWACFDSSGFDCFFDNERVLFDDTAVLRKSVKTFLESGQTYTFVLTYRKGTRSSEDSVIVRVQQCKPPKVKIRPVRRKKNTEDELLIRGQVRAMADQVELEYSFVSEDGFAFVSDLSTVSFHPSQETLVRRAGKRNLVKGFGFPFRAGSLQPGTYKFKVAASTSACSSYAETTFVINSPPFTGTFSVEPSSGTEVDTKFTFRADLFTDEDFPLKYSFGFIKKKDGKEIVKYVSFKKMQKKKVAKLPKGDSANNNTLRVFVKVFDKFKASVMVESTITVTPKVFSLSELQDLQTSGDSLLESNDLEKQLGSINTIMSAVGDSMGTAEEQEAVNQLKESYTNMAGEVLSAVKGDKYAERNALGAAASTTDGGAGAFGDPVKKKLFGILKELRTIPQISRRRRRRSVENEILDVDPLSAEDAEATLTPAANLIDPAEYTEAESTRKKDFLDLVDTVGLQVCAGRGTGAPAALAKVSLVSLRSETRNFDGIASTTIDMACSDCSSVVENTAKMTLGAALQDKYNEWNCSTGETCTGACILSSQYPNDLLLNQSDSSRMTDIVDVKLYNPETKRVMDAGALDSPAVFLLPLKSGVTFPNESYVECKLWSSVEANWTTTGCVTTQSAVVSGNISYVQCNCTQLGYLSVFKGAPTTEAPTTLLPTTVAATTPACSLQSDSQGVNVSFTFNVSYNVISNASQLEGFKRNLTRSASNALQMDECTIRYFSVAEGSIVVSFVVVPKTGQNTADLEAAVAKLETQIKSGDFNLTLPDGTVLSADKSSFKSEPHTPTTATTTATTAAPTTGAAPTESDGMSETTIIIIACCCGGVVLIVIIIVTVYCCKKKRAEGKISPATSPNPDRDDLEMSERGRFVQRKDHHGANNNPGMDEDE